MIKPSKLLLVRPRRRVFRFRTDTPISLFLIGALLTLALLGFGISLAEAGEEELDSDQARKECFEGKIAYCLALGLAEERAGNTEQALNLYRSACQSHVTPGHLRACSPLLTLARKIDRLEHEAAPLEQRCRKGHTLTCYYLGREYLNVAEIEHAARHLEPLCRSGFRAPSQDDYGPCYHLAKGYENTGQWNHAREGYQFDCEHNPVQPAPGCLALKKLTHMESVHRKLAQTGLRSIDLSEMVLLWVVVMSFAHVGLWFMGGRWGWIYLCYGAPPLIWGGVLSWLYWPGKPEFPANQWPVIFCALILTVGSAVLAFRQLHDNRPPG